MAVAGGTTYLQVMAYKRDADGNEYVRMYPVKAASVADAVGTTMDVAGIQNFQGCSSEYDLSSQSNTITVSHVYGSLSDTRISTYHHCLPD